MGYELAAAIATSKILQAPTFRKYDNVKEVELNGGFILLPIGDALYDEILAKSPELQMTEDPYPKFGFLPQFLVNWFVELSFTCELGYIEADYAGGAGMQSSIAWKNGELSFPPNHDKDAIDQMLKQLGVLRTKGLDEFEVVGLARHRRMEDWLGLELDD
jgi:hypothetical protein